MSATLQWQAHDVTDNINWANVVRLRGARAMKEQL
jgi:hypothetical protein